jgi:hypothetical protein
MRTLLLGARLERYDLFEPGTLSRHMAIRAALRGTVRSSTEIVHRIHRRLYKFPLEFSLPSTLAAQRIRNLTSRLIIDTLLERF